MRPIRNRRGVFIMASSYKLSTATRSRSKGTVAIRSIKNHFRRYDVAMTFVSVIRIPSYVTKAVLKFRIISAAKNQSMKVSKYMISVG
jgi:hypothetical protein